MSNLSDIGFPVSSEQDVNQIIMDILPHLEQIPCPPFGYYFRFEDPSGAQIFLQTNSAQEIIGFNPSFKAESRWQLRVHSKVERDTSDLDGGFECVVIPGGSAEKLLFDSPTFRVHEGISEGDDVRVGITAFASNDFECFADEEAFRKATEDKHDPRTFLATGLFEIDENDNRIPKDPPQAHVFLTGLVTEAYLRNNKFTGTQFYCLVLDTKGGFVDVVADPRLLKDKPIPGNVIKGSFWLSGQIS